jgi:PTH1 family peptidyl-tRNA hydrolase
MLLVGLGNPGTQYEKTRHNVGWIQIEKFAKYAGLQFNLDKKHKGNVARGNHKGKMITLLMPLTYMNLSGESVISVANYYKYSPEEIVVIYDDKDFDLGTFKIKADGSPAGHNGIKSIINHLNTQKFPRFRIGIGPKPKEIVMSNFVLSKFSNSDLKTIEELTETGIDAIDSIIFDGIDKAMNKYNTKI